MISNAVWCASSLTINLAGEFLDSYDLDELEVGM